MVGMMHFPPNVVRRMSLAEVAAAIDGFHEFNGAAGKTDDLPDMDAVEELMRQYPDP